MEQRAFLRVDDKVLISIVKASEPERDLAEHERHCAAHLEKLLRAFNGDGEKAAENMRNILLLLNERQNALREMLLQTHNNGAQLKEANVSASGIAFKCESEYQKDEIIRLQLTLLPQNYSIEASAQVIRCDKIEGSKQYRLALHYGDIDDKDQQAIVRHVLEKQLRDKK